MMDGSWWRMKMISQDGRLRTTQCMRALALQLRWNSSPSISSFDRRCFLAVVRRCCCLRSWKLRQERQDSSVLVSFLRPASLCWGRSGAQRASSMSRRRQGLSRGKQDLQFSMRSSSISHTPSSHCSRRRKLVSWRRMLSAVFWRTVASRLALSCWLRLYSRAERLSFFCTEAICFSWSTKNILLRLFWISWKFLSVNTFSSSSSFRKRKLCRLLKPGWARLTNPRSLLFFLFLCFWRLLPMRCSRKGRQWRAGQVNLVCLLRQCSQRRISNSSGSLSCLSRRKQKYSQSPQLFMRLPTSPSQGRLQVKEYSSDLISQLGGRRCRNSSPIRKGFCPARTSTRSTTVPLKSHPAFRQQYPTLPSLRMQRVRKFSRVRISSSGWVTRTSIDWARFWMARSARLAKKNRFWKMDLLASLWKSFLRLLGICSMNPFSSSMLKRFLISLDSSMQLEMRRKSSLEMSCFLVRPMKVLQCLLFSWSWWRMFLTSVPTQLMLQASTRQLIDSMKIRQAASCQLEAWMSPNPTVSMMLTAQQQLQMYSSYHGAPLIPFIVIQLSEGLISAMKVRNSASTWAKQKLKRKILVSSQQRSLQAVSMRMTSSFSRRSRQEGILRRMSSLSTSMTLLWTERERTMRKMRTRSTANSSCRQCWLMSTTLVTFTPATILTVMKLSRKSTVMQSRQKTLRSRAVSYSYSGQAKFSVKKYIRNTFTRISAPSQHRWNVSLNSIPSTARHPSSDSRSNSNAPSGRRLYVLFRFSLLINVRTMFWILNRVIRFFSSSRLIGPLDRLFFRKSISESPSEESSEWGSGRSVWWGEGSELSLRMQSRSEAASGPNEIPFFPLLGLLLAFWRPQRSLSPSRTRLLVLAGMTMAYLGSSSSSSWMLSTQSCTLRFFISRPPL